MANRPDRPASCRSASSRAAICDGERVVHGQFPGLGDPEIRPLVVSTQPGGSLACPIATRHHVPLAPPPTREPDASCPCPLCAPPTTSYRWRPQDGRVSKAWPVCGCRVRSLRDQISTDVTATSNNGMFVQRRGGSPRKPVSHWASGRTSPRYRAQDPFFDLLTAVAGVSRGRAAARRSNQPSLVNSLSPLRWLHGEQQQMQFSQEGHRPGWVAHNTVSALPPQ